MIVSDPAPPKASSWNRQTYHRLFQALSLGLRRQILVAVCDDLILRNRLVDQLQAELAYAPTSSASGFLDCSELISLNLNLNDPNILAQIAQWFSQHRRLERSLPTFQILGVERLTRQPADVQRSFLRCLQAIGRNFPRLESSLLLWLPRPWLHTIQQSVPEFWQWHTGIFEFEGEPTPLPPSVFARPDLSAYQDVALEQVETPIPQENLWQVVTTNLEEFSDTNLEVATEPDESEDGQEITNDSLTQVALLTDFEDGDINEETLSAVLSEADRKLLNFATEQDIELLQQSSSASPASLAEAYLNLGNYYRDRIEQGDASPENLLEASKAYEQALEFLDEEDSELASDLLNDIGNLYWMLSRCTADTEQMLSYLERGIQAYEVGLATITAETAPDIYAMIQNNLGAAYSDLARYQDPAENLKQSVQAYEESLRYRTVEVDRLKYASTKNNLGTAYWHLAQQVGKPLCVQYLKSAIAAYTEALAQYNPEEEPLNWGMMQNNLGTAYWNLAQYEQQVTCLGLAIGAYRDALKYRRADVAPAGCAATQNNLGTAYWHLANHYQEAPQARLEYLRMCVVAYEIAIALAHQLAKSNPPVPVGFDMFATQNNLGLAHYQLATDKQFSFDKANQSVYLEAALQNHLQALQGFVNEPNSYQSAFSYLVKTIRAFYREFGIQGQNLALSKIPGSLLPEILPRL
jgi:tetratricopeptide (TPR) repeat protein